MDRPPPSEKGSDVPPATGQESAASPHSPLRPAIVFTEALLPRVQGFDCGDTPWEQDVAAWIQQGPNKGGALDAMADLGTEVWLYETEAGQLVGYGSLGVNEWRYPNPRKSDRVPIQIIPYFGIRRQFQGQPPAPCPREERYAHRIFEDLLVKACQRRD
jgi:hypothetical protein